MDNGNEAQGLGSRFGVGGMNSNLNNKSGEEQSPQIQYSMPGILHFLQTEWARFETERAQWEVERAELQARNAFLQGERKGQENLKKDLVRRIKMLEYALKKERIKYNNLKYGSDTQPADLKVSEAPKEEDPLDVEPVVTSSCNTWRQGRQLLRQYLQEIGYTDTIIDVRNARVRSMLGLQSQGGESDQPGKLINGENKPEVSDEGAKRGRGSVFGSRLAENILEDNEQSVLATFDFLAEHAAEQETEDKNSDDEETEAKDSQVAQSQDKDTTVTEEDTEEALAEFDFLVAESGEGSSEQPGPTAEFAKSGDEDWEINQQLLSRMKEEYQQERRSKKNIQRPNRSTMENLLQNLKKDSSSDSEAKSTPETEGRRSGVEDEALEAALGLGELAGLTVNNEAETMAYDSSSKDAVRTWSPKYTLRSHFDSIRGVAFHPVEPVLISASEDNTLKLWNLQKTLPSKKSAALDVEPIYTFRGHVGPVLCVAVGATGEQCYSGGLDGTVRIWNLPSSSIDPYDSYDPSVVGGVYREHTEAVWRVAVHTARLQLLSCSADGSMKLWATPAQSRQKPLLASFTLEDEPGVPCCAEFMSAEPNNIVAAYSTGNTYLIDCETGKAVTKFEVAPDGDLANAVVSHPTLPLAITAHEDRHIRFHDMQSGKTVHSMVAHLDSVTSLAVDPNGLYLLSGSHDCSIRLWDMDSKTCIQEITSHRKKSDESIHAVAFHPAKPYLASAGADALCKVFV